MCFFDQDRFACGDWKWGHFRQHCNREYRIGETCGMKLIMQTVFINQNCKLCGKIDTKLRRRAAEAERIKRWQREGNKFRASIEKSMDIVRELDTEIHTLSYERSTRLRGIVGYACDDAEKVENSSDCRMAFRLVPKTRFRKGLPITFDNIESPATVMASPDSGSEENVILLELALKLGLPILRFDGKFFRMADGELVRCCGLVLAICGFGTESHSVSSSLRCIFYVFKTLASPLIMCWTFLEATETLTKHRTRLVDIPRSILAMRRIRALGRAQKRLLCSVDGVDVEAVPDSGSEVDLMSEEYARSRNFVIQPSRVSLMFANGSIRVVNGLVLAQLSVGFNGKKVSSTQRPERSELDPHVSLQDRTSLKPDSSQRKLTTIDPQHNEQIREVIETEFYVLKSLPNDILVGEDSLESLRVYERSSQHLVDGPCDSPESSELNRITILGPVEQKLREISRQWMSRSSSRQQSYVVSAIQFVHVLDDADLKENARREQEKKRWRTMSSEDRRKAKEEETTKQRQYEEYRTILVEAFERLRESSLDTGDQAM